MTEQTGSEATRTLCLTVSSEQLVCFFPMLQKGATLGVVVNVSIGALLREQIGLSPETIEKRVQTVFLDGKPVDDIERAVVRDGSTLAIAPAMPGLMGAMLRRGGYYAPMRGGITHRAETIGQGSAKGRIVVKLFGTALRELGPRLLARGVDLGGGELAQLLASLPPECGGASADLQMSRGQESVLLKVSAEGAEEASRR